MCGRCRSRHLVVLDVLRRADEARVEDVLLRLFLDELLAFPDQPFHAAALLAARALAELLADALDPPHVLPRLLLVLHATRA